MKGGIYSNSQFFRYGQFSIPANPMLWAFNLYTSLLWDTLSNAFWKYTYSSPLSTLPRPTMNGKPTSQQFPNFCPPFLYKGLMLLVSNLLVPSWNLVNFEQFQPIIHNFHPTTSFKTILCRSKNITLDNSLKIRRYKCMMKLQTNYLQNTFWLEAKQREMNV